MMSRGLWLIFVCVMLVAGLHWLQKSLVELKHDESLPQIQGVVLSTPKLLPQVDLVDHENNLFTQENFNNHWAIIAYGYTHCPDVCPLLLATLADVEDKAAKQLSKVKLTFYFYTVDPKRDTTARLKQYVPYFSDSFVGLKALTEKDKLTLEQALGIRVSITPEYTKVDGAVNDKSYQVSHSQSLFLINPRGELQAVFTPVRRGNEFLPFDANTLYEDFISVLRFYIGVKTR